jgi:hypothetical protein
MQQQQHMTNMTALFTDPIELKEIVDVTFFVES